MSLGQETVHTNTPKWTPEQRSVVEADVSVRCVVVAGPGTGKTAVACGRVAYLADQGINPSTILMFSFTRAAVAELRTRIKQWAENPDVAGARITTLDSAAWYFRHGTGEDFENLDGTFDTNIEECIELIRDGSPVLDEYLDSTSHLIIDEAQDLTSLRAELVAELVKKVPASCGITVFGDPAQSIYGFTTDADDQAHNRGTFLHSFPFSECGFSEATLERNHRTDCDEILTLFSEARAAVYPLPDDPAEMPMLVQEAVKDYGDSLDGDINDADIDDEDLVLCRRRAQALHIASFYPELCRLRMSNLPACIHPWVGAVFADYCEKTIDRQEFCKRWDDSVHEIVWDSINSDQAWSILARHARGSRDRVDVGKLRRILSRSRPHADFCLPDFGMWGPIIGTIHASKGREADRVVLMLPKREENAVVDSDEPNADQRNAEEARVYYVGATRARRDFNHGTAPTLRGATSVDSGRVWRPPYNPAQKKAWIQIGQAGDLDETALVRRDICASQSDASAAYEQMLVAYHNYANGESTPIPVTAKLVSFERSDDIEWRYRLDVHDDQFDGPIGWLRPTVGMDFFRIAKAIQKRAKCSKLKPPNSIWHLKIIGLRTIAVDPTSNDADLLYEPFASSGFLLAPLLFGFPSMKFFYRN